MSESNAYLGIWLVFAWIVLPAIVGFVAWLKYRQKPNPPAWLIPSARALLDMDDRGVLVPHGIGKHARDIIAEFVSLYEASR